MAFLCSNLFYSKVSSGFLRQDLQSSYTIDKIQTVRGPELSEQKILFFIGERFHISFSYIYTKTYIYMNVYIYICIYIYILYIYNLIYIYIYIPIGIGIYTYIYWIYLYIPIYTYIYLCVYLSIKLSYKPINYQIWNYRLKVWQMPLNLLSFNEKTAICRTANRHSFRKSNLSEKTWINSTQIRCFLTTVMLLASWVGLRNWKTIIH